MGRTKTFHIVAWLTLFSIALTMSTGIVFGDRASAKSLDDITTTTVGAVNTLGTDARRDDGIAKQLELLN